jgi:CheY-like chemotaxis protein
MRQAHCLAFAAKYLTVGYDPDLPNEKDDSRRRTFDMCLDMSVLALSFQPRDHPPDGECSTTDTPGKGFWVNYRFRQESQGTWRLFRVAGISCAFYRSKTIQSTRSCEVTRGDTEVALMACLEQVGIDRILADYSLPTFDGLSALKVATKICPEVPFIFVSGTLGEDVASAN